MLRSTAARNCVEVAIKVAIMSRCQKLTGAVSDREALHTDYEHANAAPVSVAIASDCYGTECRSRCPRCESAGNHCLPGAADNRMREGVTSFLEKRPPAWKLTVTKDKPERI